MRAALLVLVVGCTSQEPAPPPIVVDVVMRPVEIEWFISPGASCSCQNVATFPEAGTCVHDSDTPGCTCYPGACLTSVNLVHAGTVIGGGGVSIVPVPATGGGFAADFTQPDLSLRFEGCGAAASAPLANAFPDPVSLTVSADTKQISWPVVPNDGFLVAASAEFVGELCRTERDVGSQTIDLGYYTSLSVRTLRGPTTTEAGEFTFHVWSTDLGTSAPISTP